MRDVRRRLAVPFVRLLVMAAALLMLGCKEQAAPTPAGPTPRPTATASPRAALQDMLFTITYDDVLLAAEEISVGESDGQLVVFSELRFASPYPIVERRTLILDQVLEPVRYDLERSALGVRSIWAAERDGDAVDCLNNNLDWFGPVLSNGHAPAPDLLIDSPSALPYAILALRYTARSEDEAMPMQLHVLDVQQDLPSPQALTVTRSVERSGAVIGTEALSGEIAGAGNERFTIWYRPSTRALFGAEMANYRFGFWASQRWPNLEQAGTLVIQRVSKPPDMGNTPMAEETNPIEAAFTGADDRPRSESLILPSGGGPFPCLVLHSAGGVVPRQDPGDQFARRGWATFVYDKRGLGQREGDFVRGGVISLAEDALAAAEMLASRPEIEPDRIIFLGTGLGGQVGALCVGEESLYAGAILGSCAIDGQLFPVLPEAQIRGALAPYNGWDPTEVDAYLKTSVTAWQQWLFDGEKEVALLGRRIRVSSLRELADTSLYDSLSSSARPVLLLHGGADVWTSSEGASALNDRLQQAGAQSLEFHLFEGLGSDLGARSSTGLFAPEVEDVVFAWLDALVAP